MQFGLFDEPAAELAAAPVLAAAPQVVSTPCARCKSCRAIFLAVNWLSWRVNGYCSNKCEPSPPKSD